MSGSKDPWFVRSQCQPATAQLCLTLFPRIVTCALTMKYYVEENVSQHSCTTIRHVVKMLCSISETLIFLFLGVVTVTTEHEWNWAYILFTLFFALVWRGLGKQGFSSDNNPPFHSGSWNMLTSFFFPCLCRCLCAGSDHQPFPHHPVQYERSVWTGLRWPAGGNFFCPGIHAS